MVADATCLSFYPFDQLDIRLILSSDHDDYVVGMQREKEFPPLFQHLVLKKNVGRRLCD